MDAAESSPRLAPRVHESAWDASDSLLEKPRASFEAENTLISLQPQDKQNLSLPGFESRCLLQARFTGTCGCPGRGQPGTSISSPAGLVGEPLWEAWGLRGLADNQSRFSEVGMRPGAAHFPVEAIRWCQGTGQPPSSWPGVMWAQGFLIPLCSASPPSPVILRT